MLIPWIRPIRLLVEGIAAADTPRQLALGFTIGMMIGLLPKGNLTVVAFSMILLGTRVNLATGMLGALLFSWLSGWTDPLAHRVGLGLLSHEPLQPLFASIYQLPLVPWSAFDNSVVFGSLMLGVWLCWPVYHFSHQAFERMQPWIAERLQRYRVADLLDRSETVTRWRSP